MKMIGFKKASLFFAMVMLFTVCIVSSGNVNAASVVKAQINQGELVSAASLKDILRNQDARNITSMTLFEGVLSPTDLQLLGNAASDDSEPEFTLPNLRVLEIKKEVTLPDTLPAYFMSKHPAIESIEIDSAAALSISDYAFLDCNRLQSVIFHSAYQLENSIFGGCTSLKFASLVQVTAIGDHVFDDCLALETVAFGDVAPQTFTDHCFPTHDFTMRIPKGKIETYRSRCAHYSNIRFLEVEGETPSNPDTPSSQVSLSGSAEASYTVSVTPSISFGTLKKVEEEARQTLQVSAEQLFLEEGQCLNAVINGASGEFTLQTKNNSKVPFEVVDEFGSNISHHGTFAVFRQAGESKSADLVLKQSKLPYAGEYSGNLTFEFMVSDAS